MPKLDEVLSPHSVRPASLPVLQTFSHPFRPVEQPSSAFADNNSSDSDRIPLTNYYSRLYVGFEAQRILARHALRCMDDG